MYVFKRNHVEQNRTNKEYKQKKNKIITLIFSFWIVLLIVNVMDYFWYNYDNFSMK